LDQTSTRTILVIGGYGSYGRHITQALSEIEGVECIAAGRNPPRRRKNTAENIRYMALDCNDPGTFKTVLPGLFAVINVRGSFNNQDYRIAEQCATFGVSYIDLADSREYVSGFTRLNRAAVRNNVLLVTGAGFVPTISSLLVDSVTSDFTRIAEINVFISFGNKNMGGIASMRSLLSQIGKSMRLKGKGRWCAFRGWSKGRKVIFPKPAGKRRLYLCDAPDLDIFPQRYSAGTVTFRTGFELNIFNFGLSLLSWLASKNRIKQPAVLARALLGSGRFFRDLGSDHDAMGIRIAGVGKQNEGLRHNIFLVGRSGSGSIIPCGPTISLVKKWLKEGVKQSGAMNCYELVSFDDIKEELRHHDVVMVRT